VLMSDYNAVSERALAREGIPRCTGDALRVLVGGLGLGHTAHEALLSDRVAQVDVVEYVPEVIEWFNRDLMTLAPVVRHDPRFKVIPDDIYRRLTAPPEGTYDLLLVDVDHSPDDPLPGDSAAFYTAAGLHKVAKHLAPGGVLAVWSCRANPSFEATLRDVFESVATKTTVFVDEMFFEDDETNYLFYGSSPRSAP